MNKILEAAKTVMDEKVLASQVGGKITLEQIASLHGLDLKDVKAGYDLMRKGRSR